MNEAYYGEEAARNLELAGGKGHLYTLHDASHVLRGGRLRRNPGAPLRWRENVRKAALEAGRPVIRVAFVSPEPTPYRSPLLDRVAAARGRRPDRRLRGTHRRRAHLDGRPRHRAVFLDGVYAARPARRVRATTIRLRPGSSAALPETPGPSAWSSPAGARSQRRRALGWCRARRVPYVLLVESHDTGPKAGLAPPGQEDGRADLRRAGVRERPRRRLARARLRRRARCELGARARVREHDRRRALRRRCRRPARPPAGASRRHRPLRGRRGRRHRSRGWRPDKGIDVLLHAAVRRLPVLVVGSGPERATARAARARARVRGDLHRRLPHESVAEAYVAADVFALRLAARALGGRCERRAAAAACRSSSPTASALPRPAERR